MLNGRWSAISKGTDGTSAKDFLTTALSNATSNLRKACLAIALCEMFAVGPEPKRLGVEERFDPEVWIVAHEQPSLEPTFLDPPKLRESRGQN